MLTPRQRNALQEQPDSAEVYILTFGGTTLYFTSYFQVIDMTEFRFEAIPVQRDGITFTADLSDITTTLALALNTNVGALFKGNSQVQNATIEIRKYFLDDFTQYEIVFAGYIKKSEISKGELRLLCNSLLDPISRDIPRIRAQARCNNILFDQFCHIADATWKINGTIDTISDSLVRVLFTLPGGYPVTPASGFFTRGKCVKTGTSNWRAIVEDTTVSGMTDLVLHFPLNELEVGNSVDLYPGCNKTFDRGYEISPCPNSCTTFSNIINFLGMEHIPYKNPTITPVLT